MLNTYSGSQLMQHRGNNVPSETRQELRLMKRDYRAARERTGTPKEASSDISAEKQEG